MRHVDTSLLAYGKDPVSCAYEFNNVNTAMVGPTRILGGDMRGFLRD